jgi:hypothetical protein
MLYTFTRGQEKRKVSHHLSPCYILCLVGTHPSPPRSRCALFDISMYRLRLLGVRAREREVRRGLQGDALGAGWGGVGVGVRREREGVGLSLELRGRVRGQGFGQE